MAEEEGAHERISDEAVRRATGRDWAAWFSALDAAGAEAMDHRQIVRWLREEAGLESGWWQQSVTVEYEKARGKRAAVGETADAGFQVGAQRTLPVEATRVWALLTTRPGRDVWLGEVEDLNLEPGVTYRTEEGAAGEVRSVREGERVRLSWQPEGWARRSTIQVTVTAKGGKSTIGFHHERLPDLEARQAMRTRWREALDRIEAMVGG